MKTEKATIGVIANCQNCNWESQDYIKGEKQARNHARAKKYRVLVEVTKIVEIEG